MKMGDKSLGGALGHEQDLPPSAIVLVQLMQDLIVKKLSEDTDTFNRRIDLRNYSGGKSFISLVSVSSIFFCFVLLSSCSSNTLCARPCQSSCIRAEYISKMTVPTSIVISSGFSTNAAD